MDEDVVLNLAGAEPGDPLVTLKRKKQRPASKRERRQKRAAESVAEAVRKKFGRQGDASKAAALKGYSLQKGAPEAGAAVSRPQAASAAAEKEASPLPLPALFSRKRRRLDLTGGSSGRKQEHPEQQKPRPAAEGAEEPAEEKPQGGMADILAAVTANKERDARVEGPSAPGHDRTERRQWQDEGAEEEEQEADPDLGRVSFVDERRPLRPAQRRPCEPPGDPSRDSLGKAEGRLKKQRFARGAGVAQPKRGELAHAVHAVLPQQEQEAVFGPGDAPGDAATFEGLGLDASLAAHLEDLNFTQPTRVQKAAIPVLLRGSDALINAPTGSGKTLAYLAPIINDLQARQPRVSREAGTLALLVLPTRELCLQVADVLALVLRRYHWLVGGAVFGGEKRAGEKARLRRGVAVLAATPGRLLDHLQNTTSFRTADLRWLVLDEADRLLDQGFQVKIEQILRELSRRSAGSGDSTAQHSAARRQTVMLSATLHAKLQALATLSLSNPTAVGFSLTGGGAGGQLSLWAGPGQDPSPSGGVQGDDETGGLREAGADSEGDEEEGDEEVARGRRESGREASTSGRGDPQGDQRFAIPPQLKQFYVEVPTKHRLAVLAGLLRHLTAGGEAAKVVAFFSTCDGVEFHHAAMADLVQEVLGEPLLQDCHLLKLHGNLPQGERTKAFLGFSRAARAVLLCTDVAARGLDFPAVTAILQFDPPGEPTEYVHRVGRTARLGQAGDAVLALLPSERAYLARLASLGIHLARQPLGDALGGLGDALRGRLPQAVSQGRARQQMCTSEGDAFSQGGPGPGAGGGAVPAPLHTLSAALVEAAAAHPDMAALGAAAFRAHVRAYATHGADLKDVFHVRRLHLGHLAHAFALRESPSMAGQSLSKAEKLKGRSQAKGGRAKKEKLKPYKAGPLAGKLPLRSRKVSGMKQSGVLKRTAGKGRPRQAAAT